MFSVLYSVGTPPGPLPAAPRKQDFVNIFTGLGVDAGFKHNLVITKAAQSMDAHILKR